MRKKVFKGFVLLAFISMLNGCQKEESKLESNAKLLTEAEIKDIGIKHNEALGYVFKEFSSIENSKVKSSSDMENIIKSGLNEYSASLFTGDELDNTIKFTNNEVEDFFRKRNVKTSEIKDLQYNPSILEVIKENKDQFSKTQIKYLLKCESIFLSDKTADMNILIGKLDVIEESVKNELTAEEAQIVLIYLSVGRNSINYWNENFSDWTSELSGSKSKGWWSEVWRVTKTLAVEDAIGGGTAAVLTFAVNALPLAGQVSYGSAIFLGAAYKSADEAIKMVRKNYDCEYVMKIPLTISSVLQNDANLCMVNVTDLSLIETYSDDEIDLTNVALYGDYSVLGSRGTPQDQTVYLYAFKSNGYYDTKEPLSIHIDEIEDQSMEISRILVGSTTNGNVIPRPMFMN